MASRWEQDAPLPDLPPARSDSKSKHGLNVHARAQMARVIGMGLVAVMGVPAVTVQTIISERGTDMGRAPNREECGAAYERKRQERERKPLARRARQLGETRSAAPATVPGSHPEPAARSRC